MDDTETIFGDRWQEILEEITRDLEGEPSPSQEDARK